MRSKRYSFGPMRITLPRLTSRGGDGALCCSALPPPPQRFGGGPVSRYLARLRNRAPASSYSASQSVGQLDSLAQSSSQPVSQPVNEERP